MQSDTHEHSHHHRSPDRHDDERALGVRAAAARDHVSQGVEGSSDEAEAYKDLEAAARPKVQTEAAPPGSVPGPSVCSPIPPPFSSVGDLGEPISALRCAFGRGRSGHPPSFRSATTTSQLGRPSMWARNQASCRSIVGATAAARPCGLQ